MQEPDRIYISELSRNVIKNMKEINYLDFDTNKDIFLYAMALGCEMPTEIFSKKDGLFLDKDIHVEDEALIYAAIRNDIEEIENMTDKKKVYDIIQKMANTGFGIIEENINNGSLENVEKRLIAELDKKFEELVTMRKC